VEEYFCWKWSQFRMGLYSGIFDMGNFFRIFLFVSLFHHNIFIYPSIITRLPSQSGAVWLVISGDAHTVLVNCFEEWLKDRGQLWASVEVVLEYWVQWGWLCIAACILGLVFQRFKTFDFLLLLWTIRVPGMGFIVAISATGDIVLVFCRPMFFSELSTS
jgi:hypothetical protein